ncbi:ATP-binding protein [Mesorhizobium carmichaelinearum]|uniref:ATP-binding protein n=1 Tax=Mesorhizobium carmichaelinearum TaxID=1208188 RepID=UPI000BA30802|nr:ATP-binding protein [Mesorhizobium carmichaelinearum]
MPKVIYLTGAPAAGKSSTTRLLAEKIPDLLIWEYGARLTEYLNDRCSTVQSQEDLRSQSAGLVTPSDVAEVDKLLATFVDNHRSARPIIIDSHPVTKEAYGYRITAFSFEQIARLKPDEIWVVFASPEETRKRIANDPGGRPMISDQEARMHTGLQASVATTYGIITGSPVYLFDTGLPRETLIERMLGRLS